MKRKLFLYFCLFSLFIGINDVKASNIDIFKITDEKTFEECLQNEAVCQLTNDLNITSRKEISREVIIDLNGHSIVADSSLKLKSGFLTVNRGAKLTINDSKGNGKISTGSGDNVWSAIQMIYNDSGTELAELVVNGGTIEGYYYGIVGNGNNHNTKITVNDGTIKGLNKEDSAGIYQPQNGDLIINNGTISGGTGIEIRSGNLTVNNGNISATASEFIKMVNKSGTTTNGVGIAVAQHITKNPIKVEINKGNISGQYAFYEWNPHNNSKEDLDKVKIHIYGGEFTGLAKGVPTVYSQDIKNFISGGNFNKDVSEYYVSTKASFKQDSSELSEQKSKQKNLLFPSITIVSIVGAILGILYCKKSKVLFFK